MSLRSRTRNLKSATDSIALLSSTSHHRYQCRPSRQGPHMRWSSVSQRPGSDRYARIIIIPEAKNSHRTYLMMTIRAAYTFPAQSTANSPPNSHSKSHRPNQPCRRIASSIKMVLLSTKAYRSLIYPTRKP